jgi:hypothetical protein
MAAASSCRHTREVSSVPAEVPAALLPLRLLLGGALEAALLPPPLLLPPLLPLVPVVAVWWSPSLMLHSSPGVYNQDKAPSGGSRSCSPPDGSLLLLEACSCVRCFCCAFAFLPLLACALPVWLLLLLLLLLLWVLTALAALPPAMLLGP